MSQTTIIAIFFSFIFSLSTDNPWIYSEFIEPSNPINYAFSIGTGSAESYINSSFRDPSDITDLMMPNKKSSEGGIFFKYSLFKEINNSTFHGISYTGYTQQYNSYGLDMMNRDHESDEIDRTSYMLCYSFLKTFKDSNAFNGFYYGYDAGIGFTSYKINPLGIIFMYPILDIFDSDDRSDIGLGGYVSLGYAFSKLMISFQYGMLMLDETSMNYSLQLQYKNF